MTVDASRRLVVVESPDNVLYDMRVTPETQDPVWKAAGQAGQPELGYQ